METENSSAMWITRSKNGLFPSYRLFILCLSCLQIALIASLQGSIAFAWVCMVANPLQNSSSNSSSELHKFHWDATVRQNVFAADSIGALILMLPGGYLINRFGCRFIVPAGILISATANLLIPVAAPQSHGYQYLTFLRSIQGSGMAVAWPSIYYISSRWSPGYHLGFSMALVSSGLQLGSFAMNLLAGIECQNLGWPSIFYIIGAVSAVSALTFVIFFTNDPSENRFISKAEKAYIISKRIGALKGKPRQIPWSAIATSSAFYSCVLCSTCHTFLTQVLRRFTPLYFQQVVGLAYLGNALYTSLQYIAQLITRIGAGFLSDRNAVEALFRSKTRVLKFFNTVCFATVTGGLCALAFMTTKTPQALPIFLIIFTMGALTVCSAGWQKSPLLMAPALSGVLGSLIMFSGGAASIAMPYVFSAVVPSGRASEWQEMFFIGAGLSFFALIVFLVFGTGEQQKWAQKPDISQASSLVIEKF